MTDLETRIDELEWKLREHSEHLNAVIAQRDRLCIDAAWGTLQSIYSVGAYGLILFGAYRLLGDHWWTYVAGFFAATIGSAAVSAYVNGLRIKEVERFRELPDFQP